MYRAFVIGVCTIQTENYLAMKTSSLLFIGVGIAFISLTAHASNKKDEVKQLLGKLQFRLSGIQNINVSLKSIALDLVLQVVNPTSTPLKINTGFVTAKVLRVYEKKTRKLLAFTNLNTHQIHIPSGGFYQLPPTHIKIPLLTGGQMILNQFVKNKQGNIHKDFAEQLAFELDLEAVGYTQTIEF